MSHKLAYKRKQLVGKRQVYRRVAESVKTVLAEIRTPSSSSTQNFNLAGSSLRDERSFNINQDICPSPSSDY